jgi:metal-dependent amidase/aminoacylase/carboxypeptidase family protein
MQLMVHPGPVDVLTPRLIACRAFNVEYSGKAAHAAAFPELGINAADALTIAQVALGLLRQQLPATDRIHGILTKGGDAPNIIPAHTAAQYMVRAETFEEVQQLSLKVRHCFEAGALATGASLHMSELAEPYAHLRHDAQLVALYGRNAQALGRTFSDSGAAGSTDMGNVSLVLPTIHPMVGINSLPVVNHQPEFTAHCITQDADQALLDGALAMAWTAIDMATNDTVRSGLLTQP